MIVLVKVVDGTQIEPGARTSIQRARSLMKCLNPHRERIAELAPFVSALVREPSTLGNEGAAQQMIADRLTASAFTVERVQVDADADCLVTPCPLCHLNVVEINGVAVDGAVDAIVKWIADRENAAPTAELVKVAGGE